ncbi:MAG: Ig-like domain repeat protein, partial [Lachnospiraceae bacterium]|nr:Ig-like domain repeat protein [Lachnospiraceae bacterium]
AGEAIELTPAKLEALKKGTDKTYQVYVDTYSIYEIEEVYLADKDGVHKITQGVVDTEKSVFDPVSKQYRYVVTFDIPSEVNAYFDELSIYTKDAKKTSSVELITILYDDTDPLVLDMDGEELTITTDWVDKIDVDYEITSGDGDVESLLGEAFCTIESAEESLLSAPVSNYQGNIFIDESSKVVEGTTITIAAKDLAGNTVLKEYVVKVDADSPVVDEFTVAGSKSFSAPIKGDPEIDATISDNLTFKTAVITVVGPTGTFTKSLVANGGVEEAGIKIDESYALSEILGDTPKDGDYEVTIDIEDKAGNTDTDTVVFRLDNTDPVVTADIASGTVSTKSDYYYNTAVGVDLTVTDINLAEVKVTDNGEEVSVDWSEADANGKSVANIVLSDEGAHQIKITAKDKAGTDALPKEISFYIDETDPVVSVLLNGGIVYDESMGMLDITRDVTLDVSVSDTNEDKKDLNYQLIQTKPDEATTTAQYIKTDVRSFTYTEEAEYTINLFSIDKADNQGNTRTVKFRIDNTAPVLTITGASAGGSSVNATTVTFTMQEAFWWDAHGTVNIYRQPGDGMAETLLKTIEITPTAKSTSVSETLADTGVYRFEFTASDRAGHTTETSQQFTVDREDPLVTLTGAANYDITDKIVEIYSEITDDFYSTKKVEVVGTRTDIDGKVHTIEFSYNQSANPTVISKDLTEDGIYDISVTATDMAGNSDSKSLHFTIDKSEPVIGDLSKYDGTILTEFNWDEDLDELISDLTVCDVHMYLNGSEYDGTSKVEDGAYTLLIVAEDEMGNKVEKSVEFVLDTKAPVILVTGVEEDEVRMEDYNITVSLQLEEDTLTSVLLNGKPMTIGNNVCTFTVSEKGEYKLEVFAVDAAGNDVSYEMEFKYGEESVWWIWLLIALAALLVVFFIIIILKKKGKEEEKK